MGTPEFLVKWKGYTEEEMSWEPLKNVAHNIAFVRYAREQPDLKNLIPGNIVI